MACYRFCKHCGKRFRVNHNPQQRYCPNKCCQHYRKTIWRKAKMNNDADYRANQKAANKRWQSKNPDYWQQYRSKHPDYVAQNCCAQRVRDGSARLNASHLAKSDALVDETLVAPGTYWLMPGTEGHLAKSDALLVKILVLPGQEGHETHLAKR